MIATLLTLPLLLSAELQNRVNAHLLLGDPKGAYEEVESAKNLPEFDLLSAKLKIDARLGNEKEMVATWKKMLKMDPELKSDRNLIEEMAWGVIEKGTQSGSVISRIFSLIAAVFSNSSHGVSIVQKALNDSNANVRLVAVELASAMRDGCLQNALLEMIRTENNWNVRVEAIRSVGKMKCKKAHSSLLKVITSDHVTAIEKAAALESLVYLFEHAKERELNELANSSRAVLRQLCAEVIGKLVLKEHTSILIKLTQDYSPEVRLSALQALGILNVENVSLIDRLDDRDPEVAITAAWFFATLGGSLEHLEKWLYDESQSNRLFAAAALASSGAYGIPLAKKIINTHRDPYVRLNAALALMGQQVDTLSSAEMIYSILNSSSDLWMSREWGIFKAIGPTTLRHQGDVPRYPEAVDSMTRLEVLQVLAIAEFPKSIEAARKFLQERSFGVTGTATALLLTEGNHEALLVVKQLLHDSDLKVRVQAALVLAMWGRDEAVISALESYYHLADRDTKEKILEGLGRIGAASSLPFLAERFDEPHQNLRIIAAAAALQCAHH